MSLDGPGLLSALLDKAKKAGADAADAMLVESQSLSVTQRLGKLENVERSESADLGLRLFIGKRQAIVSTSDLAGDSLDRLIEGAVAIAKSVPEDAYAGLADPERIATDMPELDLDDGVDHETHHLAAMAAEAEDAARQMPKISNSEGATAGWSRTRSTLAASNGFVGESARSGHSISASVIAGDGDGPMERDYDHASRVRAADLPDPAEIGRKAAERAARRVNPVKVKSQSVPVVFDPRVAGSIIRHLISAISGPAVARGTTFLRGRLGDEVFAQEISIVEEPHRPNGLRSRAFDAEGLPASAGKLIDQGRLTTWLLDCASARQLDLDPTGHAVRGVSSPPSPSPSNVYLEPGALSQKDLIATITDGFYVMEMLGMGVNAVTGDYSRGAAGLWIEHGELGFAVSEVTIAGSLPDMFKHITAANDLEHRTGMDAPTLRIDGLTIAGE
ncbi:MAG: TldD/PmbA family protein [Alphaproteobacteria bacterium]|nr:TldD/PmbA family protein [Alphaproteobacteria bacterium]